MIQLQELIAANLQKRASMPSAKLGTLEKSIAELGADVPVFVGGFAAWADGVGEQLTPIKLPECHYLVIYPNILVSTAQIFNAEELTRNCDPITIRAFQHGMGRNVCEPV